IEGYRNSSTLVLLDGKTDAEGIIQWQAPFSVYPHPTVKRMIIKKGRDILVLDPNKAPDEYADNHWNKSRSRWLQWAFAAKTVRGEPEKTLAHIFTERPVYRPEETVHIKGYIRTRQHGLLDAFAGEARVVVKGPGSQEWPIPVDLTGTGSFYAAFSESEIPTGTYLAEVKVGPRILKSVSFNVEAYKLPRFEVNLHGLDTVPLDRPFDINLIASYYAGGRVVDRPVRWRVTQYPYTWTPQTREGFVYSSDGRYSRNRRFDSTPSLTHQVSTDDNGSSILQLDPTIEPTAQPRTYVVEATVTGADEQTVTTVRHVRAVPSFVIGIRVPRFLETASHIKPDIIVAGPEGGLIANKELTVRLIHRQWHSHLQASDFSDGVARYITDVVDDTILEKTIRSGTEPIPMRLPIEKAGVYLVEVEGHDKLGRATVVSVDLYAGGDEALAWSKPKAGVFEVTPDHTLYEPGDKATVLIKSPYQQARALVIVEEPSKNRYEWVDVRGGKATLSLDIEDSWVPRIPVHVVLMRGRTGSEGPTSKTALDLGKPTTVASTSWLQVAPVENTLQVNLKVPEKAQPGDTIDVAIDLRDNHGEPVSGEVTLWLVDQAVLALGKEQRLDPLPDFITDRRSYVSVHDTRNSSFGRLPFSVMPGGDGEEEELDDDGNGPLD
ncbi:MAG: alpha-2-macroglobulin, partial [Proteobacteria bacterium]|nr:alpha-2-macroglobulin [Pseudomonadota bacterium]